MIIQKPEAHDDPKMSVRISVCHRPVISCALCYAIRGNHFQPYFSDLLSLSRQISPFQAKPTSRRNTVALLQTADCVTCRTTELRVVFVHMYLLLGALLPLMYKHGHM